jgi:hypothetical protein
VVDVIVQVVADERDRIVDLVGLEVGRTGATDDGIAPAAEATILPAELPDLFAELTILETEPIATNLHRIATKFPGITQVRGSKSTGDLCHQDERSMLAAHTHDASHSRKLAKRLSVRSDRSLPLSALPNRAREATPTVGY